MLHDFFFTSDLAIVLEKVQVKCFHNKFIYFCMSNWGLDWIAHEHKYSEKQIVNAQIFSLHYE